MSDFRFNAGERTVSPWLVAMVASLGAWVFTGLAWTWLQPQLSLLFVAAVAVAAYYGGSLIGLAAVAVNLVLTYLFLYTHSFAFGHSGQQLWRGSLLLLVAAAVGRISDLGRKAEQHAQSLAADLNLVRTELASQKADFGWFHKASVRLSSSLELSALLREIVSVVAMLQDADAGVLLLRPFPASFEPADTPALDAENDKLELAAHTGFSTEQAERLGVLDPAFFSLRHRVVMHDADGNGPGVTPELREAVAELKFRALFSTPILTSEGQALGVVVSCFKEAHQPSEREMQAMELYARQAANAIENARSYGTSVSIMQQEQRRAAVLRALSEASVQINSALALDSLLQTITERAREIVGAHQAFTSLAPQGNWTQSINCVSLSPKYRDSGGRQPERSEMFVLACSLNKPLLVTAESQRKQPWWSVASTSGAVQPPSGWVAAPLITRDGRNLGLIQLSGKIDGEFKEEDQSILVQLAQMASVAVENVRLYREAQEQITERGRAQEALQRSKDSLHLAQQAAGIGVFEWDLQNGTITWSDEIAILHGMQPREFDGKYETWINTIYDEDREHVHKAVARAIASNTEYEVQYRVLHKEGTRWLEARGQSFSTAGTPVLMLGMAMDITTRKQSEEALRRSEKLAATGRLAAAIAHEVNNPLAAVTNVLFLLRTHDTLDDEARKYVATAELELSRVTHITRQTLGFYRDVTHPVETNAATILDELLCVYAKPITGNGITVTKKYDFEGTITAFHSEIRQVFSNLLLNAIEAVPHDGTGAVRLHVTRSRKNGDTEGIRIMITDNGPGISTENRERIFEPFFTTKGQKGTGLGLWVSQGIVNKHGGEIRARTFVDGAARTTCFGVFLPFEHLKRTYPTTPAEAAAA